MKLHGIMVALLALLVVGGAAAALAYNWVLGPTLAASGDMTAIPVVASTDSGVGTPADQPTASAIETTPAEAANVRLLRIVPEESEARFILSEVLRGQPTTVVGATEQVAGEIAVDPNDLATTQVGIIQINARDLATDIAQRDRAIRNRILNTDSYEFITFTPTKVVGLAGSAKSGDTFSFQIAGDLTIRDTTQPVVFDVTATVDTLNRLSGVAVATVQRSAFNLVIPSVPQVADVSEEVRLELDFVAVTGS